MFHVLHSLLLQETLCRLMFSPNPPRYITVSKVGVASIPHHTLMHLLYSSHEVGIHCTFITGWDSEHMEPWSSGAAWSEDGGGGRGTREGG